MEKEYSLEYKNYLTNIFEPRKEYIENNKWDEFFEDLKNMGYPISDRTEIARILLLEIGIPIFYYMSEIPEGLFSFCQDKRLTTIVLPKNIKVIGPKAFRDSSVKEVYIEGARVIQGEAFSHCEDLKKLFIGEDAQEIEYRAFSFNPKLVDIEFENAGELIHFSDTAFKGTPLFKQVRELMKENDIEIED